MKTFFLSLCILLNLSFFDGELHLPVLSLESTKIECGTVKKGSDFSKKVEFKNTGSSPLIITKCEGSCICTAVEWPKYAIQPGKTESITIKYNTEMVGNFSKTVSIYSNNRDGVVELSVSGIVAE